MLKTDSVLATKLKCVGGGGGGGGLSALYRVSRIVVSNNSELLFSFLTIQLLVCGC